MEKERVRTISLATSSSQTCPSSLYILAILLLPWKQHTYIREEDAENKVGLCGVGARWEAFACKEK